MDKYQNIQINATAKEGDSLVRVENLKKYYPIKSGIFRKTTNHVKAVDDVSFCISKGRTLGLVGESGCGKTTVGRTILRLQEKTAGHVYFNNIDIFNMPNAQLRTLRPHMQLVFQDPYSSLNPRLPVSEIIGEAVREHHIVSKQEYAAYLAQIAKQCGLQNHHLLRYPHEFSGGQRQRICIARALALKPQFIVADECVSALDVSIQAQIINLLMDLQEQYQLTYLFISHDLSVVEHICDEVAVMYLGSIVEKASKQQLFNSPLHPYTQALLSAVPKADPTHKSKKIILNGDIPSPSNPPSGCTFHTRCPQCISKCKTTVPPLHQINEHSVRCHRIGDNS
ncbi:MAG: ABC transporter ATP-binding protein [Treponemataceae bacterium]